MILVVPQTSASIIQKLFRDDQIIFLTNNQDSENKCTVYSLFAIEILKINKFGSTTQFCFVPKISRKWADHVCNWQSKTVKTCAYVYCLDFEKIWLFWLCHTIILHTENISKWANHVSISNQQSRPWRQVYTIYLVRFFLDPMVLVLPYSSGSYKTFEI
jgi:hypothetical protein